MPVAHALGPITVLAVATFAGCLGPDPLTGPLDNGPVFEKLWSELALPFGLDHTHEDVAQHAGRSTPNFEILGHDPLFSDYYGGVPAGGYLCGDAAETLDGRRLAAVESRSDVGFAVADVTDPANPKWLGEFVMRTTHVYDLAVVPDGKHVVLVTSEIRQEDLLPNLAGESTARHGGIAWRTPCDVEPKPLAWASPEDPVPRPASILLVSIENPAEPAIIDHQPLMGYGHSAYSTTIEGRTWVMVTTTRPYLNEVSAYEFFEIVDGPTASRLNLLSFYKPPPGSGSEFVAGPRGHDGWLAVHPKTGVTTAYLVGGDRFTTLDMSDPQRPRELGRWTDCVDGREGQCANLHSVYPLTEVWGDHHYTLVGPEWGDHPRDIPSGILWVLDTTDPAKPFEVAAWTLPHEVEWAGVFMFSNHYFTVVDDVAFISMYHGGVWAIDLSSVGTVPFVNLPSVGVFLPDRVPENAAAEPMRWAPTVEEVLSFSDGSLVTFDSNSGLYTFRFLPEHRAPPPEPWPLSAVEP